ncbi:MAG: permease prefix domain 1-containing protein, partial [Yaniella sp.]|nr:permease prefix domain 1-containing protein [Yaniella sp.]
MTTPLPERYIAATVKYLSPELQAEVRPELHASIADAVEAQVAQGEDYETAERNVLTELGDPAVLAASYSDRTLQLIGPRYYLSWWCLLKRLLLIVPAAVLGVVAFAQLLAGGDLGDIIGGSIGAAVTAG